MLRTRTRERFDLDVLAVTDGAAGARVWARGGARYHAMPPPGDAAVNASPVGAGDAFAAGMLSSWVLSPKATEPDSVLEAVRLGCLAGTYCCTKAGACVTPVRPEDLESLAD